MPILEAGYNVKTDQKIINPEFRFWLDSVSETTTNAYCGTVHKTVFTGASGTCTRGSHALGTEKADGQILTYFCQDVVSAGSLSTDYYIKNISIPWVKSYAGKNVAVRIRIKATVAGKYFAIRMQQIFGTSGSPSTTVVINGFRQALTTDFADYTFTFAIPEITGSTLGTDNNDCLRIQIYYDSTAIGDATFDTPLGHQSGTFQIGLVTINEGLVALPYVPKHDYEELSDISRVYQKSYDTEILPGATTITGSCFVYAYAITTHISSFISRFKISMDRTPTIKWYSTTGAVDNVRNITDGTDLAVSDTINEGKNSSGNPVTAGTTATKYYGAHWTADCRY